MPTPESIPDAQLLARRDRLTQLSMTVADLATRYDIALSGLDQLSRTPEGLQLVSSYEVTHQAATQLFGLVGEVPPAMDDAGLVEQLTALQPQYERFEREHLQPQFVLGFEHKPLNFWQQLGQALEQSQFNPILPGGQPGQSQKLVRNGGLWVADEVQSDWQTITNPRNQRPTWKLALISSTESPTVTNVTSYGYIDSDNTKPSPELNRLLQSLGRPLVPDRTPRSVAQGGGLLRRLQQPVSLPLTQPDVHPTHEAYVAHQFSRIIQRQGPIDASTWSWLNGQLASGDLSDGDWDPGVGQVRLDWDGAGRRGDRLGVRPSVRGQA